MPESVESTIEEAVDVDADPGTVWALVSDLPAMNRRSPQVVKTVVWGGPIGLGTQTLNINRKGLFVWPTRARVVRFEPYREFAFRIKENLAVWSFTLEESEGRTWVVHRRQTPDGLSSLSLWLQRKVLGGVDSFQHELRQGMQQTLHRLKSEAETRARLS